MSEVVPCADFVSDVSMESVDAITVAGRLTRSKLVMREYT